MVVVEPEADFVTGMDTELVTQLLRDDDLTFPPNSVSHTAEYNHPGWRDLSAELDVERDRLTASRRRRPARRSQTRNRTGVRIALAGAGYEEDG